MTSTDRCNIYNHLHNHGLCQHNLIENTQKEISSIHRKIITDEKIIPQAIDIIKNTCGYNIVFTNGCFDALHIGHIKFLEKASTFGTWFIVAINSDESVKKIKGSDRPLFTASERACHVAALDYVNCVFIFNDETATNILNTIRPHVYVKSITSKLIKEEIACCRTIGCKVKLIEPIINISTSDIIKRCTNDNVAKNC